MISRSEIGVHPIDMPGSNLTESPHSMSETNRAVVLLSGGLDSATTLAMAKDQGYECHALSFVYGQRHDIELRAAIATARDLGASSHRVIEIDLRALGGSALTSDIEVPKDREENQMSSGIPVTYVPARNTIFLSYALAVAEVTDSSAIFIGVNSVDYSGYPDCRPEYISAFQSMANLATKSGVEGTRVSIETPLIKLKKSAIIEAGLALGVNYGLTHSCYDPQVNVEWHYSPDKLLTKLEPVSRGNQLGATPCGRCDSCRIREKAFAALGMKDPATL